MGYRVPFRPKSHVTSTRLTYEQRKIPIVGSKGLSPLAGFGVTVYAKSQITYEVACNRKAEWDTGSHFAPKVT